MLPNELEIARKCEIKHWLPCGADGRTGGQAVFGHVITEFSRMGRFTYPWCSAGALRAPELRYKELNKGNKQRQGPTLGVRCTEVSVL